MSHSGNQGPDWFFGIFGRQNSNAGVARFVAFIAVVILVCGTAFWMLR